MKNLLKLRIIFGLVLIPLLGSCVTNQYTINDYNKGIKPLNPKLSYLTGIVPTLSQFLNGEPLEGAAYLLVSALFVSAMIPKMYDGTYTEELSFSFPVWMASLYISSYVDGVITSDKRYKQYQVVANEALNESIRLANEKRNAEIRNKRQEEIRIAAQKRQEEMKSEFNDLIENRAALLDYDDKQNFIIVDEEYVAKVSSEVIRLGEEYLNARQEVIKKEWESESEYNQRAFELSKEKYMNWYEALGKLHNEIHLLDESNFKINVSNFDTIEKQWIVTIESINPLLKLSEEVVVSIKDSSNIEADYLKYKNIFESNSIEIVVPVHVSSWVYYTVHSALRMKYFLKKYYSSDDLTELSKLQNDLVNNNLPIYKYSNFIRSDMGSYFKRDLTEDLQWIVDSTEYFKTQRFSAYIIDKMERIKIGDEVFKFFVPPTIHDR